MASLITIPAPGLPMGISHHGPPSISFAPKYCFATSYPQSRKAPSVNFMMFKGRGDAFEVLHWPQTNEKVEELPQRNIERTNAASHGSGQRAFDSHVILAERFHCIVRQPFTEFVLGSLAGEHLKPRNLF